MDRHKMLRVHIVIPLIPTIKPYFCFKIRIKALSSPFESEISIEFEAPIWEVRPAGQLLFVTTRDKEQLQTQFSLFDLESNEFVFSNLAFEEDWWVSLYQFNGKQAVFQHYDDTQDIEKRSVFCFDCDSQQVIWSFDHVKLQQVNDQIIKCSSIGGEEEFFVAINTGDKVDAPSQEAVNTSGTYPIQHAEETAHYNLLIDFVNRHKGGLVGPIDYLEHKDFIFISANFRNKDTYSLFLFVYDSEGALIEEVELENDLSGQAIGTFFILDQALIFVEKKHKIQVRRPR